VFWIHEASSNPRDPPTTPEPTVSVLDWNHVTDSFEALLYICVRILLYMCPHTAKTLVYVFQHTSIYCICVCMCPHTATCDAATSDSAIYVRILLCICPHTTTCARIYICPHTVTCDAATSDSDSAIHVSAYYCICVRILLHVSAYYYISVRILLHVSAYYYMCVRILLHVSAYYCMCPHTTACVRILLYVCPHTTACVRILLYLCPHTTACVRILLYVCPQDAYYYMCDRILLCMRPPHTIVYVTVCVPAIKSLSKKRVNLFFFRRRFRLRPLRSRRTLHLPQARRSRGFQAYADVCGHMLTYADIC
jgi:hypothetical protein